MFWRKKQKANPEGPITKEAVTDMGKVTALDFGTDTQQCFDYLKAAVRKENAGMACFVSRDETPALWALLCKAHISGRVWTADARAGRRDVSLFKPLGVAF